MSQEGRLETGTTGQFRNHGNHSLSQNLQNSAVKLKKFWKRIMVQFFDRQEPLGNWTFFAFCLLALVTHSMFYQLPEIKNENDNKKCVQINKVMLNGEIAGRSVIDFIYFIYSILQLHADLKGKNSKGKTTKSWLLFLVDVFIILPIPQVLTIIFHPKIFLSAFPFLIVQLVPRIIRMSPHLRHIKTKIISRGLRDQILDFDHNIGRHLEELLFACAVFIFFLYYYLTAGSVFGVLWHYLAIRKITARWKKPCINSEEFCSFYSVDPNSGNYTFLDGLCPRKTLNETKYDFGIYGEALQSQIVLEIETPFNWKRWTYCLRWGLQSLSGFGQGLQPSTDVGENIFVLSITIVGVLLLVFSIGFGPMMIEKQFTKLAKMAAIRQSLQEHRILGKLLGDLRQKIEKYLLDNEVQITKDIDVENLLNYLSDDIKTDIKHELCLPLLKKVEEFVVLREGLLKELCDYVKPVSYTAHTHIVHMREPVYKMIFVLQGELWTYTTNIEETGRPNFLKNSDFCGDELLDWIQNFPSSSNLLISNRAIVAHKKVEAFVLTAYDLQTVFAKTMPPEEPPTQSAEPQ